MLLPRRVDRHRVQHEQRSGGGRRRRSMELGAGTDPRTGVCLVILGLVAHVSHYVGQLPHVFGAVAQESLLIYFVHLCVVYGSIWNSGLYRFYGEALTPTGTALAVVAVVLPMIALAWQWNGLKHARPRVARAISLTTGAVLVALLL
jgi:hypothetical protein